MNPDPARDSRLKLDEPTHTYTLDGKQELRSVSSILNTLFEPFDPERIAQFLLKRRQGCTLAEVVSDLRQRGHESREIGKSFHLMIHMIAGGRVNFATRGPIADMHSQWKEWMNPSDRLEKKIVRSEWPVFSERWKVAGTIDAIVANGCQLWLVDWKTNKAIAGDTRKQYNLQLQIYDYILRTEYGVTCDRLVLVQVHEGRKKAREIEVWRCDDQYIEGVLRGEHGRKTEEEIVIELYDN